MRIYRDIEIQTKLRRLLWGNFCLKAYDHSKKTQISFKSKHFLKNKKAASTANGWKISIELKLKISNKRKAQLSISENKLISKLILSN